MKLFIRNPVSGSYPLQLQGEPTCPRGQSVHTRVGTIEKPSKLSNQSESSRDKAESQEKSSEPGGPTEKEAEVGVNP